MVRRILAVLSAVLLMAAAGNRAGAAPEFPGNTEGQRLLQKYLEAADSFLIRQGEPGINSLFEAYRGLVIFGITDQPDAEVPEEVEITARLFENSINSLELRVSNLSRFPRIAASFIAALFPEGADLNEALRVPTERMQRAAGAPGNSFEDEIEILNGTMPYVYYAYYPNQYKDGVNWMQMTIVFPLEGYWDGYGILSGSEATHGPDTYSDHSIDYEGYDSEDDFVHYEVFVTATPEPDSAAAIYDTFRK